MGRPSPETALSRYMVSVSMSAATGSFSPRNPRQARPDFRSRGADLYLAEGNRDSLVKEQVEHHLVG